MNFFFGSTFAGDIYASSDGERVCGQIFSVNQLQTQVSSLVQVYCIFLFLYAASLFGTLISQVNEIVAANSMMFRELDTILEAYFSLQPRYVDPTTDQAIFLFSVNLQDSIQS